MFAQRSPASTSSHVATSGKKHSRCASTSYNYVLPREASRTEPSNMQPSPYSLIHSLLFISRDRNPPNPHSSPPSDQSSSSLSGSTLNEIEDSNPVGAPSLSLLLEVALRTSLTSPVVVVLEGKVYRLAYRMNRWVLVVSMQCYN